MQDGIKVSPLGFLLESPKRLCILVTHIAKHTKSHTPVLTGLHRGEEENVTPSEVTPHMIHCRRKEKIATRF